MSSPRIEDVPMWYHTLELADGVITPGWFDLRGQSQRLPWPDVRGKRCLDVGTYDGFYAFELERRGAAEVLATDIPDHEDWDWPASMRLAGGEALAALAGEKGRGFEVAHAALRSSVRKRTINVYDLSPEEIGTFDVVVCGSILLHLRDPVRALEAIASVCSGWLLSIDAVSLKLSVLHPRRPTAELAIDDRRCQWWTANAAGHRRMVEMAGFEVTKSVRPFCEPFGAGHPSRDRADRDLRSRCLHLAQRALTGNEGVPHAALLARPRPSRATPRPERVGAADRRLGRDQLVDADVETTQIHGKEHPQGAERPRGELHPVAPRAPKLTNDHESALPDGIPTGHEPVRELGP